MRRQREKDVIRFMAVCTVSGVMALSLNGCMMAMNGIGDSREQQSSKVIVKELDSKDLFLSLEVPSLSAGRVATLIVRTGRIQAGTPVEGAHVTFVIEREDGKEHGERLFTLLTEREAEEESGIGVYQLRYKFEDPGKYKITARVLTEEKGVANIQNISIVQEAGKRWTFSPWMILAVVGMVMMRLFAL